MAKGVYPGTFDPVTNGHMNIILRATQVFDEVVVAVAQNGEKEPLFSLEQRMALLREACAEFSNVKVDSFGGLLVKYVQGQGASVIIRGLRAVSDFEFELQMALMNRRLAPEIETVFLMTDSEYSFLSSSVVKEVATLGGRVTHLVPKGVEKALSSALKMKGGKANADSASAR
jgi:pantetheine-phosphate adenylyltransferase